MWSLLINNIANPKENKNISGKKVVLVQFEGLFVDSLFLSYSLAPEVGSLQRTLLSLFFSAFERLRFLVRLRWNSTTLYSSSQVGLSKKNLYDF